MTIDLDAAIGAYDLEQTNPQEKSGPSIESIRAALSGRSEESNVPSGNFTLSSIDQQFMKDRTKASAEDVPLGVVQSVLALGTELGTGIATGLTGAINSMINKLPGTEKVSSKELMDFTGERLNKLVYEPTNIGAKNVVGAVHKGMEALHKGATWVGNQVHDYYINFADENFGGNTPEDIQLRNEAYDDAATAAATVATVTELGLYELAGEGFRRTGKFASRKIRTGMEKFKSADASGDLALQKEAINDILSGLKKDHPQAAARIPEYADYLKMKSTGEVPDLGVDLNIDQIIKRMKYDKTVQEIVDRVNPGDVKEFGKASKEIDNIKDIEVEAIPESEYVFRSKSGNFYTRSDGKWYDSSHNEVTNKFVIRAAERGKVEPETMVADTTKEIIEEQAGSIEELSEELGAKDRENNLRTEKTLSNQQKAEILWNEVKDLSEANQRARKAYIKETLGIDVGPDFKSDKPYLRSAPKPKIKKQPPKATFETQAKKYGLEVRDIYDNGELVTEENLKDVNAGRPKNKKYKVGDTTSEPVAEFFDPQTGEYFDSYSPNNIKKDLEAHRKRVELKTKLFEKMSYDDFNKMANDIIRGKSDVTPEQFLEDLRVFTEEKPQNMFETTADYEEHVDMGREFAGRFRNVMRERNTPIKEAPRQVIKTREDIAWDNLMRKIENDGDLSNTAPLTKEERLKVIKQIGNERASKRTARTNEAEAMLENGSVDKQWMTPEETEAYLDMLDAHEEAIYGSEPRSIDDVFKDIKTLLGGEEGSVTFGEAKLSHEKAMALQRLIADGKRAGKTIRETLEPFGLDEGDIALLENYLSGLRRPIQPQDDSQPINTEATISATDGIVKQRKYASDPRTGQQITDQPIYWSEVKSFLDAKEIEGRRQMSTETVPRTFDEAGVGWLNTVERQVRGNAAKEKQFVLDELKTLGKELKINKNSRKRIMAHAYAQQGKRGIALAKELTGDIPVLTENELYMYDYMRKRLNEYEKRINKVRNSTGRESLVHVDDYFTFMRTMNMLARKGVVTDLLREPAAIIHERYMAYKNTPFKFARQRRGGMFSPEADVFKVYGKYISKASDDIHMSPFINKVHQLTNTTLKDLEGNRIEPISKQKPNLARSINEWNKGISGHRFADPILPSWLENFSSFMRRNLTRAGLGGNVRTMLLQPAAINGTQALIGVKYTIRGFIDNLDPVLRRQAMDKSSVLINREPAIEFAEASNFVGRASFKGIQYLDLEAARSSWLGAHRFATEVLGKRGQDAINYADDIVVRTQASASPGDIAPIQRYESGKALTLFQTFVINNWDLVTKDILGWKRPTKITDPGVYQKALRYFIGAAVVNMIYEDVPEFFGAPSLPAPYPRVIKEGYKAATESGEVDTTLYAMAKELLEPVPIIGGSIRYGSQIGGPTVELADDILDKFSDAPMQKSWVEIGATGAGVPGTAQVGKYIRGKNRGQGEVESILGTYEKDYGGGNVSRKARSGRSSRGGH